MSCARDPTIAVNVLLISMVIGTLVVVVGLGGWRQMFCSQCLMAVGPRDRVCSVCGADLTAPGSVRLTDPRRIATGSQPAPSGPAAVAPVADAAAAGAPAPAAPQTVAAQPPAEPVDTAPAGPPQAAPAPAASVAASSVPSAATVQSTNASAAVPPTPAPAADDGPAKASQPRRPKPPRDERLIPSKWRDRRPASSVAAGWVLL